MSEITVTAHVGEIEYYDGVRWASCSCGWYGFMRFTESPAKGDLADHYADVVRVPEGE